MTKHLDNVCIMQKYNDSENVLELREQFKESEAFIKKAVNCHDELVEALEDARRQIEMMIERMPLDKLATSDCEMISRITHTLKKASQ